MPEFGVMLKMDADYDQVRFYGYGPNENYVDRREGARLGIFKTTTRENVSKYLVPQECGNRTGVRWGTAVPNLAGEYFLVTGSGKYFRNVTIKPEDSICMIELDEKGENYRIVWGLVNGGRPTSELPSHLMNLEVKKLQDERYRVVYHAHTTNVIALTFVLPLEDKVFTRELWEMATECPVVFSSGIGVVPWMVPGGREIAVATSELMKKYDLRGSLWSAAAG